jgi:glycosyltransferase involved in cell wall biosynthesis
MKIAVWHNLPSGGAKRALYYQVRGLVQRGHEVTCWCLDNADQGYLPLSEFATERVITQKQASGRWSLSYNEALQHMRAFDDACRQCANEIDAGDFDVVFVNGAIDYGVPYVLRHLQTKNVLYLQEPCRFLYEARPQLPWISGTPDDLSTSLFEPGKLLANYPNLETLRVRAKQEWLNAHACDLLLVNSYFSRESVLRSYGLDAKVCYLGVDTKLFRDLKLKRQRLLVGLGALVPSKGVELAVEAVSLLKEPRPPLIWIANSRDETYEQTIRELARALKVDLQICFRVADEELVRILNQALVMLYTSRLEPFGLAPLEANACGLPVVGIAEGGIRETVVDGINGLLVEAEAKNIASAVDRLLNDPALTQRLSEQAVDVVQTKWNVEDSVDRLENFLIGTM